MKAIFIIIILFGSHAFSGEAENQDQFYIRPMDPSIDASKLADKNVTVLPAYDQNSSKSSLPSMETRDKIFTDSNLWEQVKDWDDFDRDSLYILLEAGGEKIIAHILKKHPELDRRSLERAQNMIALTKAKK
jgi:hypothetical protein